MKKFVGSLHQFVAKLPQSCHLTKIVVKEVYEYTETGGGGGGGGGGERGGKERKRTDEE